VRVSGRVGARKGPDDEVSPDARRHGTLCYSVRACSHAVMTPPYTEACPADSTPALPGPASALAAPPPDVQSLLDSEASPLVLYFDAQRALACASSQRDWPQLWRLARAAG
jgi:hypothetical protein